MILIEHTKVEGWEAALRGMRNPMNSWDRADTTFDRDGYFPCGMGENDHTLAQKLADAGQVHGKFLRMINVTCDITAPMYWWQEFDTYKVGTVRNSCSKMHKIHSKEFTVDDFSHDHLIDARWDQRDYYGDPYTGKFFDGMDTLSLLVNVLNFYRVQFLGTGDKKYWWQMIQLLPASYNQRSTVQMNYAVLKNIYPYRKDHKLDEWQDFCIWIERLPYAELITGGNHE